MSNIKVIFAVVIGVLVIIFHFSPLEDKFISLFDDPVVIGPNIQETQRDECATFGGEITSDGMCTVTEIRDNQFEDFRGVDCGECKG